VNDSYERAAFIAHFQPSGLDAAVLGDLYDRLRELLPGGEMRVEPGHDLADVYHLDTDDFSDLLSGILAAHGLRRPSWWEARRLPGARSVADAVSLLARVSNTASGMG
jgi:hypothetical protein